MKNIVMSADQHTSLRRMSKQKKSHCGSSAECPLCDPTVKVKVGGLGYRPSPEPEFFMRSDVTLTGKKMRKRF